MKLHLEPPIYFGLTPRSNAAAIAALCLSVLAGNASAISSFGFEALTQFDAAALGRNSIPPDTMGAVGTTQFMSTANGVYGVFDKTNGARLSIVSDFNFWRDAGYRGFDQGLNARVMFNADAQRWIVSSLAYDPTVNYSSAQIRIAVSNTADALGGWKSTSFTGYAGLGFGGLADFPTLAIDKNAVYIGTSNFAPPNAAAGSIFRGTTLNVIPINSLFNAGAPALTGIQAFVTPFVYGSGSNTDRGFVIQGVNSSAAGSSGKIVADSLVAFDNIGYAVNGLSPSSATGSTLGTVVYAGQSAYTEAGPGRQPAVATPANRRIIDTLDTRIGSSVYEVNGRIYMVQTVNPVADGVDEARVHYTVLDSTTFAKLAEGDIGAAGYDYYQGSLAVNAAGKVVIGYNRSGLDVATGNISFLAQVFDTAADGSLLPVSGEILLKTSLTDDYHNGSGFGLPASGRQRWGGFSQVTVDPTDPNSFYAIGEFAREYNLPAFGHPGGTGGSRWGTWVGVINTTAPVPEPSSWLMMILGMAAVVSLTRRQMGATA